MVWLSDKSIWCFVIRRFVQTFCYQINLSYLNSGNNRFWFCRVGLLRNYVVFFYLSNYHRSFFCYIYIFNFDICIVSFLRVLVIKRLRLNLWVFPLMDYFYRVLLWSVLKLKTLKASVIFEILIQFCLKIFHLSIQLIWADWKDAGFLIMHSKADVLIKTSRFLFSAVRLKSGINIKLSYLHVC